MESLLIQPFRKAVSGSIRIPGSKSITNRALILAALSRETLTLEGALFSDDTRYMAEALRQLGILVDEDLANKTLAVIGKAGKIPQAEAKLYVGNAGTAARFLTAMLTLREGGVYQLDGSEAMRKRPMRGLLDALKSIGAAEVEYQGEPGFFPFTLKTKGISPGTWEVDASASSQILSALLMIAPLAAGPVTLKLTGKTVSHPFIGMTLAMMAQFGIEAEADNDSGPFSFAGSGSYRFPKGGYPVEPDATAASYFMMLPWLVEGQLALRNTYGISLQGDIRFIDVLGKLGAFFEVDGSDLVAQYRTPLNPGLTENFNPISDTFLTLAAITPLLTTPTTISGIAHTRHQETDRIAAMATELRKLGQQVDETDDSLTVTPNRAALIQLTQDNPISIDTYEDHRVAMSFGILGSYNLHGDHRPWLKINDPLCCAKTFPHFFEELQRLGKI